MTSSTIGVLLFLACIGLFIGCVRRVRLWNQGVSSPLSPWLILSIPRRYLVDLHHIVSRDRYIANTHIAAAGGVVGSFAVLMCLYWFGFRNDLTYGIAWGFLGFGLIGALFVLKRRLKHKPHLSGGSWNMVPFSLMAYSLGFLGLSLAEAIGLSGIFIAMALILAVYGLGEMIGGVVFSRPLKHFFSGSMHLAFHPRQDRFESVGQLSTDLKPMDPDISQYGVGHVSDFTWNQLLSFDACVECGKCQEVCPAQAAGQPLNPKKLIQDLLAGVEGRGDETYAGDGHPGILLGTHTFVAGQSIVPHLIEKETLYSCTTCRACVHECPMMIEHVDAIIDLRRFVALEQGGIPGKSNAILDELRHTDTVGGFALRDRANWSIDLDIRIAEPEHGCDILFWSGESAYELRNQKTLRLVAKLLKHAGLDVAVIGENELDTGDLARRLGDELLFQSLAERNIRYLKTLSFNRILTIDPHVYHALSREYEAFGGHFNVVHHTQLLNELLEAGKLVLHKQVNSGTVTYHDPCYLGRYSGELDAPRALIAAVTGGLKEMERSGMKSRCCGWGGGSAFSDIPGDRRIPDMRMDDIHAVEADIVAVACPNCMTMLEGVVQDQTRVVDVVELLAEAVGV